jgi:orotate phosphoribosyltransferase
MNAALVADRLDLPFCYVRSKPKEHGMKNLIEGELPENSKVLVIEDLISTGGSSMEAVQALLQPSYEVVGVLSIFQYGFLSAVEKFNDKNVKFKSLTDFQTLLVRALQANYISSADYENLKSWNLNPKLWSDQFINHN